MPEIEHRALEHLVQKIVEAKARAWVAEAVERFWQENEVKLKELSLLERVIRVEEELKALREIEAARFEALEKRFEAMEKRFEALQREMDKRFEAMDKRFEALEKRLSFIQWFMGIGFTVIVVIMTLINFLK